MSDATVSMVAGSARSWRRASRLIAAALFAVTLGMIAFLFLSLLLPGAERLRINAVDSVDDVLTILASLLPIVTLPLVGLMLALRRPDNTIGWLLLLGGLGITFGFFGPLWVERSIVLGSDLPGYRLFDWIYPTIQGLGFVLVFLWVPLLFPDGRLPGPGWRPLAWVAAAALGASGVLTLVLEEDQEFGRQLPNPFALGGDVAAMAELVNGTLQALSVGLILLALLSVGLRFRRASGAERQQLKWFLAALILVIGTMMVMTAAFALGLDAIEATFFITLAAISLVPIAIGVAVLRYRLYEIDRIISRTIGWALVTGLLVAAFALLVVGSSAVLEPLTGGDTLAVAGSTLAVALLFAPLRSRVQRAVDRRFDRSRYDGERLIGAFGERRRDEVDLGAIRADVITTVDAAVRPSRVGLWLRGREEA